MKKAQKITMRDIAREAGVSVAAVSQVMNDKGNLPESTRKAVRELAQRMGYVPNPMARALRGASTGCVGVVINYFNNPFFRSMFAGLQAVARQNGFAFMVSQSNDELESEKMHVRLLAERGVDGLIVLPCGKGGAHFRELTDLFNIPVVLISHTLDTYAAIEADNLKGARMVAEHFLGLGGRRTNIHLAGPQEKSGIVMRKQGFCEALQGRDPDFEPRTHIFYSERLTAEGGFQVMERITQHHKPPFNIFAVNDEVALGVLRYCRENSLRVPEDAAVAGFSDIDILEAYGIALTTVHIPARRMGENAMELLLDMRKNENIRKYPPTVILPVSLVVRESTVKRH